MQQLLLSTSQQARQDQVDREESARSVWLEHRQQLLRMGRLYEAATLEAEQPAHLARLLKRSARIGILLELQDAERTGRRRRAASLFRAYRRMWEAA